MNSSNTPDKRSRSDFLFPYPQIRPVQEELMQQVKEAIVNSSNLIVHAPTGLGKTIATLGPALRHAIDKGKKVFFLTSRHTQHLIAIDTLREIKDHFELDINSVDIIGKKWMCSVPEVSTLYSNEFAEYCKKQREEGKCEFHTKLKSGIKLTTEGKLALEELKSKSPCHIEEMKQIAEKHE
ncbi:DEAD/DEAH box helicase, partial [Nanoarchaeota archaeon]